jgi:hypothetical protein
VRRQCIREHGRDGPFAAGGQLIPGEIAPFPLKGQVQLAAWFRLLLNSLERGFENALEMTLAITAKKEDR